MQYMVDVLYKKNYRYALKFSSHVKDRLRKTMKHVQKSYSHRPIFIIS